MSAAPEQGSIPEWDLADRMRKTLRESGVSVQEIADYFGVARNTVGNWINGHVTPSFAVRRLWAVRFGVPLAWLETGEAGTANSGPGLTLPHLDSNQKPFGFPLALAA